jgi:hypothetical protein
MARWLERDPAGYQDGPSLYSYLGRNPMAGTDPYGLSFWDDFKEGLGYFFGDDFDAKEAERKLRDAQRLLEERLREQVERGIISTDAQLSMVERMERDISAAAAQMHEIEAQQAKMVRDTAIEIGITVATAGAGSIALRAVRIGTSAMTAARGGATSAVRAGSNARMMRVPSKDFGIAGTRTLGYTTESGLVFLRPGLSRAQQITTLRHESVHAFLSVRHGALFAALRQRIGTQAYHNSHLLRFTEEALAETYARRSIVAGVMHPLRNGYGVSMVRVVLEAGIVGGGIGGATSVGYHLGGGGE